jgi:hypothetical protein
MFDVEELERFGEDGFIVCERLIEGQDLDHFVGIFDELVKTGNTLPAPAPHFSLELTQEGEAIPGRLHKVQGVCVAEPRLKALAAHPLITERAAQLLQADDLDVFGTKFFPKLGGGGTSTHWHQDNFYFGTQSPQVLSCGIYLQDADLTNGCLRVVPGSHHTGLVVDHQQTPGMHGSWTQVEEQQAVDLITPAGTVVLFSANLLHGTGDNHSQRTRYSTAWHYIPGQLELEQFPRDSYEDRFLVRPMPQ